MSVDAPAPRRPTAMEWIICSGVMLFGLFCLMTGALGDYRITAEDDLTLIEGIPEHGTVEKPRDQTDGTANNVLRFSIEGKRIEYSSDRPSYDTIVAAVAKEEPIQVWVSTRQETLFRRDSNVVPLYKFKRKGKLVLSYADTVAYRQGEGAFLLKGGGVISAVAAVALGIVIRNYLVYRRWARGRPAPSGPAVQS